MLKMHIFRHTIDKGACNIIVFFLKKQDINNEQWHGDQ